MVVLFTVAFSVPEMVPGISTNGNSDADEEDNNENYDKENNHFHLYSFIICQAALYEMSPLIPTGIQEGMCCCYYPQ